MTGSVLTENSEMMIPNKEKVIKGLECCTKYGLMCGLHCDGYEGWTNGEIVRFDDHSAECPYLKCETGCVITLARDALELLKEQDAIKPEWSKGTAFCGNCGHRLEKKNRFTNCKCQNCGRPVKWE